MLSDNRKICSNLGYSNEEISIQNIFYTPGKKLLYLPEKTDFPNEEQICILP